MGLKDMLCVTKSNQLGKKDLIKQLEANKSSIKDSYTGLTNKTKSFEYQITLKVKLKNTKVLKLNFLYFILIQQQKQ